MFLSEPPSFGFISQMMDRDPAPDPSPFSHKGDERTEIMPRLSNRSVNLKTDTELWRDVQVQTFYFFVYVIIVISVGDPDPHVFGPPGSGSLSQTYGSGSGSGSFPFLKKVLSGLK
jgi:hypothetical protein